jgi:TetR/AcrR family transcriptional regulator, regulator of cefoperazone and chloramphenicol sensitivity
MASANTANPETRQRILEAAGRVFAEKGFRGATVREICDLAVANIAAINYHFGDKEKLYLAVVRWTQQYATDHYPPFLDQPDRPVRERLCHFVHNFLLRVANEGRPSWHGKLMAREMADPTGALDEMVRDAFVPMNKVLRGMVRELVGPDCTEAQVRFSVASIVGQCLFYNHSRSLVVRVHPDQALDADALGIIADHITSFSLAGIEGIKKRS